MTDLLRAFEQAAKAAKGFCGYVGGVRQSFLDAYEPGEVARQQLLDTEERDEVWPGRDCGNDAGQCAEQSSGANSHLAPRDQEPRCARCDSKLGEVAAVSDLAPGMFCSSRCQKSAEIQQVLNERRNASSVVGAEESAPTTVGLCVCGHPETKHGGFDCWDCTDCGGFYLAPSGLPAGVVPPAAAGTLTWEGWAVPAICEVLAEHRIDHDGWFFNCYSIAESEPHASCPDLQDWREHIAPLIAARIACDPVRASQALKGEL